jgi:epoxyqueuosine reductase
MGQTSQQQYSTQLAIGRPVARNYTTGCGTDPRHGGPIATIPKSVIEKIAADLGFDLCGVARPELDSADREHYLGWLEQGFAGEMGYMSRVERQDIRTLMPEARSVICLGMNYHTDRPLSTESTDPTRGWIARYGWGDDYHDVMRERMEQLVERLRAEAGAALRAKIYVDTGPLLERAVARAAGLGWVAKNTCIINEGIGSWLFLGAILTDLELAPGIPVPDRCGTCTACLDACPTGAIIAPYVLNATRCISYYTIEVKGSIPEPLRPQMGRHVFGCDICQDVCPWNRSAPTTSLPAFSPREFASEPAGSGRESAERNPPGDHRESERKGWTQSFNPPLEQLASLTEEYFNEVFRGSPIRRPKYRGFLRNVCVAMGNSGDPKFRPALERLAAHADSLISEHARWALARCAEKIV